MVLPLAPQSPASPPLVGVSLRSEHEDQCNGDEWNERHEFDKFEHPILS